VSSEPLEVDVTPADVVPEPLEIIPQLDSSSSDPWTYSATLKIARRILGPLARVKRVEGGRIRIGIQRGPHFLALGSGSDWVDAVKRTFLRGDHADQQDSPDREQAPRESVD
jgi:hypothetical protein